MTCFRSMAETLMCTLPISVNASVWRNMLCYTEGEVWFSKALWTSLLIPRATV